jgi:hypothetical protein
MGAMLHVVFPFDLIRLCSILEMSFASALGCFPASTPNREILIAMFIGAWFKVPGSRYTVESTTDSCLLISE